MVWRVDELAIAGEVADVVPVGDDDTPWLDGVASSGVIWVLGAGVLGGRRRFRAVACSGIGKIPPGGC